MSGRPLVLTMGEPAGVGGELTLKAWLAEKSSPGQGAGPFAAIDDPERLSTIASSLGINVPITAVDTLDEVESVFADGLPVLPEPLTEFASAGAPSAKTASAVRRSIERAVHYASSGDAAAMVTNPIQKSALYDAGFDYPGHTEYLASLAGVTTPTVMMLTCAELRAVPVTIHESLRDALTMLTTDLIVETATITADALKAQFGVKAPRLAVAGVNPHSGEGGAMGHEDHEIVAPAITALKAGGIDAKGPYPPDTLFSPRVRQGYDVAVCMYHDQALIPVKALDFDGGVNVTLGLPFIRTSPDHGTALDIAGKGVASEASLLAALRLARQMADSRA